MKSFIEDIKKEVVPKIKLTFEKGQKVLSILLNRIDFQLTKTIRILLEQQEKLKQYLTNRDILLKEINRKEQEVNQLKGQIKELNNDHNSRELDLLRKELSSKLDDLISSQRSYYELEQKIEDKQNNINKITQDKQRLEQDRNLIRSKYDEAKSKLKENENKTSQLEKEIKELREQALIYEQRLKESKSEDEIEKYETLLAELQNNFEEKTNEESKLREENKHYRKEYQELEKSLVLKITELSKLSGELNLANILLDEHRKEKDLIKSQLHIQENELKKSNTQIGALEKKIEQLRQLEKKYLVLYETAVTETQNANKLLAELQEDFTKDLIEYEDRLKDLNNELVDKQNEISIIKADKGEAVVLTEEEKAVLEREYEPRFVMLYKDCKFYPEFFSDFFQVTSSDRLKIEAAIAQLNYHYPLASSRIRPNTIQTKTKNILEYPFGTDSVGRIYFSKENNVIHMYRVSRTKNGRGNLTQDNVIQWLKRKL